MMPRRARSVRTAAEQALIGVRGKHCEHHAAQPGRDCSGSLNCTLRCQLQAPVSSILARVAVGNQLRLSSASNHSGVSLRCRQSALLYSRPLAPVRRARVSPWRG